MYYVYCLGNRIAGPFVTETEAHDYRNTLIFDEDGEIYDVVPINIDGLWSDVDVEAIAVVHSDFE